MTRGKQEWLRVFVALDLADAVRAKLGAAQDALRPIPCRIGWVAPANLHLTLVFLGDILPESLQTVKDAMDEAAVGTVGFALGIKGLGTFGASARPRVIWAGSGPGKELVQELYRRLTPLLRVAGFFWDEREFLPHITIGRLRSSQGAGQLMVALEPWRETDFGTTTVDRLLLIQSHLLPQGPAYTLVHAAGLGSAKGEPT